LSHGDKVFMMRDTGKVQPSRLTSGFAIGIDIRGGMFLLPPRFLLSLRRASGKPRS
jgi:hypothetical protein